MSEQQVDEKPIIDEYKNNPVLHLDKFFSFGLKKAKLILKNLQYIQKFVESNGKSVD